MATITFTRGTTLPDSSAKSDFHNLVDTLTASISGIVDADVSGSANISDGKLATLTTGGKVNLTALRITSQALGDTMYASSSTVLARLAGNITTTRKFLSQTGDGAISAAPEWSALVAGDLTPVILTPKEYTDGADTSTSDEATVSTSYVDTTLTLTATTGKQGLNFISFSARGDSSSGIATIALLVDGTVVQEAAIPSGAVGCCVTLAHQAVLSAASHTVKIQQKGTGGGSCTLKGTVQTSRLNWSYPT